MVRRNALAISGVTKLDDSKLVDTDLVQWRELAEAVGKIVIQFEGNSETIGPAQREDLTKAAELARAGSEAGAKLGRQTQIEATGEMFRASLVATALATMNAPPCIIRVAPPKSGAANTISLRLQLLDNGMER